jgi:hypothetical protein
MTLKMHYNVANLTASCFIPGRLRFFPGGASESGPNSPASP